MRKKGVGDERRVSIVRQYLVVCSVKEKVYAETAVPKPERSRRDRGGKKSRKEPKKRARKSELAEKEEKKGGGRKTETTAIGR